MRILAIETSGMAAGTAVLNDDKLEGEIFLNHKLVHSVMLFPLIDKVMSMAELKVDDIDAVAVSGGPGSFTGLRIGVAAAKGIAQGKNKKFIGISSLDANAFMQVGFNGIVCPMMDALRDNVYYSLYTWQGGEFLKITDYDALHIDELLKILAARSENIMFCGDAAPLHKERIIKILKDRAFFAPLTTMLPHASAIAELALMRLKKGEEDSIYTYSPVYIRLSQAEREYAKKMGTLVK